MSDGDNRSVEQRLTDLEEQPQMDPVEVAAVRRLLHRGALEALEDDEGAPEDGDTAEAKVEDASPVEKAEAVLERLSVMEDRVDEVAERAHLMGLLSGDRPVKRARKMSVVDHLREKASRKRNGKTKVESDTIATLADVSSRTARTYMDELADEIPGASIKEGEDVGDGKQLRLDLTAYEEQTRLAAEVSPPR